MRRRKRKNKQMKFIMITSLSLLFILAVGYAAFSTNLNITAKGNILEKSRVIKSWSDSSDEDFHTDFYRENIITATFLDTNKVPDNAIDSWDVSEARDGGVMAYVTESSTGAGKYDLFIGATRGVVANEDSSNFFFNFTNIISIEFNGNFDTSNAVNMEQMFRLCTSLIQLDLSSFDVGNVTNMTAMFNFWSSEQNRSLDSSLTTIIFGKNFNTINVTSMHSMFAGANKLINLDLSSFNTSNVVDAYHMFYLCTNLVNLDISNFDTVNMLNMQGMFQSCSNIKTLNLCNFNTKNATNMSYMFLETSSLEKVYVGSNWVTTNSTTNGMFTNSGISNVTIGQCR